MFHIEIWSKTYILLKYEENLRGQFLGNSTFLNTLFWPKTAIFWPRDQNFGTKFQKHSVRSYLGPKNASQGKKLSPLEIGKIGFSRPPKSPRGAPEAKNGPNHQ